jgi:hypothetical protein
MQWEIFDEQTHADHAQVRSNAWGSFKTIPFFLYYDYFAGFEVLTELVVSVAVLWDITPCSPYVNRLFERRYDLHLQG